MAKEISGADNMKSRYHSAHPDKLEFVGVTPPSVSATPSHLPLRGRLLEAAI